MAKEIKKHETDRKWTVRVEPERTKSLGDYLSPGHVIMHNRGPGTVDVDTGFSAVGTILRPGDTRIIRVRDKIRLTATGTRPTTLEFEYRPTAK